VPIVGEVPMIRSVGETRWEYDPTFRPKLPRGAIAGDITRQNFCCATPRFAYIDEAKTCVQCGEQFTFSAQEQRYWYESLQFNLDSHAIRCTSCRRQRRTANALRARYALAGKRRRDDDAISLIEFAESLCEMVDRTGAGKASDIVAAARMARCVEPEWADPLYWEARGQLLNRKPDRAAELFATFLAVSQGGRATKRLVDDARARLAA
jgi:Probable zinc-ribbon domain